MVKSLLESTLALRKFEEDARKSIMLEQVSKKHPSLRIYHRAIESIKNSDLYQFRPGRATVKNRKEGGFGPISTTCATFFGVFQEIMVSPVTILGSPWILNRHLKLKQIKRVCDILDELYLENKGSKIIENFLERLHLSYPEVREIQELGLIKLKQILIVLDNQGEYTRSIDNEIVDQSDLFASLRPRKLINIDELAELVCEHLQNSEEQTTSNPLSDDAQCLKDALQ